MPSEDSDQTGHIMLEGMFSDLAAGTVFWQTETIICLCWGFTAQSTQWGHVKRGQFT